MKNVRLAMLAISVSLSFFGCATFKQVPRMKERNSSGVGLSVKLRGPAHFPTYKARSVYFAKVDDINIKKDAVYESNFSKDGRVYLLNASPGEYVAVAASYSMLLSPDLYITYFPKELVNLTRVRVDDGAFVYAGNYHVAMNVGICEEKADEIQIYYAEKFAPGQPKCGMVKMLTHELNTRSIVFIGSHAYSFDATKYHYRGALLKADHESSDKVEFMRKAQEDLSGGGWGEALGR